MNSVLKFLFLHVKASLIAVSKHKRRCNSIIWYMSKNHLYEGENERLYCALPNMSFEKSLSVSETWWRSSSSILDSTAPAQFGLTGCSVFSFQFRVSSVCFVWVSVPSYSPDYIIEWLLYAELWHTLLFNFLSNIQPWTYKLNNVLKATVLFY